MSETTPPDLSTDNYDVMLEKLDWAIDDLVEKIETGRIRDIEREQI
jgi:hypothetical protein